MQAWRVLMDAAYVPGARWRTEVATLSPGLTDPATALAISPDGRSVLAGLLDGNIVLWEIASQKERLRLRGHLGRVNDVVFGRDGLRALSGGDDGQVILWNLTTGQEVRRFGGHSGVVRAVDISSDDRTAASGGFAGPSMMAPGELILWDLATGEEISAAYRTQSWHCGPCLHPKWERAPVQFRRCRDLFVPVAGCLWRPGTARLGRV